MKIEIYLDASKLDLNNISITNFREQMLSKKVEIEKMEFEFPNLGILKGNRELLQKSFLDTKKELLN